MARPLKDRPFILEWVWPGTRRIYQNRFSSPSKAHARYNQLKQMGLTVNWVKHPYQLAARDK